MSDLDLPSSQGRETPMQRKETKKQESEPEIIMERYKVQYFDARRGEWREFGAPVLSLTEEGALKYFAEYSYFLKSRARIVKVTEQVLKYL